MSSISEKIKNGFKNFQDRIRTSENYKKSIGNGYIKSNTESTDNEEVPKNLFYKILYSIRNNVIAFFELIMMVFLFILILVYLSVIIQFIDSKRASYTSAIKDNNTEASLVDYNNMDFYGGAVFQNTTIINFAILCFIAIVLFIKMVHDRRIFEALYQNTSNDDSYIYQTELKEKEVIKYTGYMIFIIFIVYVIYMITMIYTYFLNPLEDLKKNLIELQTKIYDTIQPEFLWYVLLDKDLTNKYILTTSDGNIAKRVDGTIIYVKPGTQTVDLSMTEEYATTEYKKKVTSLLPDKITFDVSSIHNKIDEWLYKNENNKTYLSSTKYRCRILITAVILVYYINTKNMDPIIKSVAEDKNSYRAHFFLYADKDANSILPSLSILQTTALYKTVIAPLGEKCATDKTAIKEAIDTEYKNFKEYVDTKFKIIKSKNNPFNHKLTIIANFLLLLVFIAFFIQLFYWRYYQRTILKYWKEFLLHYGRFIVLAVMVIFVI